MTKFWKHGRVRIAIFGLENQTEPDADMPFRVIGYDGAAYRDELRRDVPGRPKERYPVVTLTLYMGTKKHWDKPLSLTDCFDVPEELAPFVNDYRVNLAEIAWLTDEEVTSFESDFRFVAEYLHQKRKKRDYSPTKETIEHVEAVLDLLTAMSGGHEFEAGLSKNIGKGARLMSTYLEKLKSDCREAGRAEGRAEGRERGLIEMVRNFLRANTPMEYIVKASGMTEADIRALAT